MRIVRRRRDQLFKDVVFAYAGRMHNLYIIKAGDVYSFGCNGEGPLGRDTTAEGSEFTSSKVDFLASLCTV